MIDPPEPRPPKTIQEAKRNISSVKSRIAGMPVPQLKHWKQAVAVEKEILRREAEMREQKSPA